MLATATAVITVCPLDSTLGLSVFGQVQSANRLAGLPLRLDPGGEPPALVELRTASC